MLEAVTQARRASVALEPVGSKLDQIVLPDLRCMQMHFMREQVLDVELLESVDRLIFALDELIADGTWDVVIESGEEREGDSTERVITSKARSVLPSARALKAFKAARRGGRSLGLLAPAQADLNGTSLKLKRGGGGRSPAVLPTT